MGVPSLFVFIWILIFLVKNSRTTLSYSQTPCGNSVFERRHSLDNYVSSGNMLTELSGVSVRGECFSQCLWRDSCNLVLYKPDTSTCRLYSDAFHSPTDATLQPGWLYYGVPCDQYRLKNSRPESHVLTSDPSVMCISSYYVTQYGLPPKGSCLNDNTWSEIPFHCGTNRTYTGQTYQSGEMVSSTEYEELLPFELRPGMIVTVTVSGDDSIYNEVNLRKANGDYLFHLSIRWPLGVTKYVSRSGGSWDPEIPELSVPADSSNYTVVIHIFDTQFKIHVDGSLLMTVPVRDSMANTDRITVNGMLALTSITVESFVYV